MGPPWGSEPAPQELRGTHPFLSLGDSCSPEFQQHRVRAGSQPALDEAMWLQQNELQNSGTKVEVSWGKHTGPVCFPAEGWIGGPHFLSYALKCLPRMFLQAIQVLIHLIHLIANQLAGVSYLTEKEPQPWHSPHFEEGPMVVFSELGLRTQQCGS